MAKHSKAFVDFLLKTVEEVKGDKSYWNIVHEKVNEQFPQNTLTKEGLRSLYRFNRPTKTDNIKASIEKRVDELGGRTTLVERLVHKIKNGKRYELSALADLLKCEEDDLLLAVTKAKIEGHTGIKTYKEAGRVYIHLIKKARDTGNTYDFADRWKNSREIKIGVLSDTHLGSEYDAVDELNHFYDVCLERGVTDVFHAGDLVEGFKVARALTFVKNRAIGFQDQLNYAVEKYPKRPGIRTYVISGNHDLWYMSESAANIVKTFANLRDDVTFLGDEFARVWLTPKLDITLYHPNDGSASNVFTKLQNFIDRGGDKVSKINIIGHYHKLAWIKYKNSYAMYPASFQHVSAWMNINNLRSEVGAMILTLRVDQDGELLSVLQEHIDYNEWDKSQITKR